MPPVITPSAIRVQPYSHNFKRDVPASPIQPAQLERNYDYFLAKLRDLGPVFADRAALHNAGAKFVTENITELQQIGFLAAAVPSELGGSELDHSDLCNLVRILAQYCPSTA
ncbi:MAG: acyl-CoA dehydrogenase family protein, partial [Deinococcota bacterium]